MANAYEDKYNSFLTFVKPIGWGFEVQGIYEFC